ncbi:MAG: 4a-hydroxytetrahydrobiopterin dehydratase, partial [Verrucomicrobia bacterium]|nr:4a-hydroxytetrahydrobiopterin dehydratase [Verrucomicrobiota bacterium]
MSEKTTLAKMTCVPCKVGVPPMQAQEIEPLLAELGAGWEVKELHHLEKEFT